MTILDERIEGALREAEDKAIDSLGRYKFQMFGYWAAIWVHLNRIRGGHHQSPFQPFVRAAREIIGGDTWFCETCDREMPGSVTGVIAGDTACCSKACAEMLSARK